MDIYTALVGIGVMLFQLISHLVTKHSNKEVIEDNKITRKMIADLGDTINQKITNSSAAQKELVINAEKPLDSIQNKILECREILEKMKEMHRVYTSEGAPIWYVPHKKLDEILNLVKTILLKV